MTSQPPFPGPVERFRAWLGGLIMDIGGRVGWGGITQQACILVNRRLMANKRRIFDIIDRLRAGTYTSRRGSSAPRPGNRRPRPPEPIPQTFGWAAELLPKDAGPFRNALLRLLQEPEMIALLQAAPGPLGRPLRSFCWMFRLRPPPVLARPRKPKPPQPPPEAAAAPAAPEAGPPRAPAPQPSPPGRATSPSRQPPPRARGAPHPA
jgi:hypothetical protein